MTNLIARMGYVAIATPEPAASAAFIASLIGARTSEAGANVYLSTNDRNCELVYLKAPERGIAAVGLEVADSAALDEIQRRARADGVDILSDRPIVPEAARAIRLRTPFGPILEIHTPVRRDRARSFRTLGVRRLDHVNLRASDPKGMHDLLTGMLGMELSDRTEEFERGWYRAADGHHHTLAVGEGSGMHHYSFDAWTIEAIVNLADRLAERDRTLLWGPGRHGAGDNLFSYFGDADGCVCEVCWGMERIDSAELRPPRVWSLQHSRVLNLWGAPPPPEYGRMLTPFVEFQG